MTLGSAPSFDSMSNFPSGFAQGVQVQGMPILNSYPGRVFWMDSLNGGDGNRGTFQRPFASLAAALRMMSSPAPTIFNDLLMVKPGHRENISSATALSITLSGVTVIGLGVGDDRPTFVLDTVAGATINILGASVTFQNCRFTPAVANVARLFNLGGASVTGRVDGTTLTVTAVATGTLSPGLTLISATPGFQPGSRIVYQASGTPGGIGTYILNKSFTAASGTITTGARNFNLRNCEIVDTNALNFLNIVGLSTVNNASDGLTILGNNIFLASAAGAVNLLAANGTCDRVTVANNHYRAKTTATGAVMPLATGRVMTNATIVDNVFDTVMTTAVATGILVTTDQTTNSGVIARNFVQNLDATTPILATLLSGFIVFENYYASVLDHSGALTPVV